MWAAGRAALAGLPRAHPLPLYLPGVRSDSSIFKWPTGILSKGHIQCDHLISITQLLARYTLPLQGVSILSHLLKKKKKITKTLSQSNMHSGLSTCLFCKEGPLARGPTVTHSPCRPWRGTPPASGCNQREPPRREKVPLKDLQGQQSVRAAKEPLPQTGFEPGLDPEAVAPATKTTRKPSLMCTGGQPHDHMAL